MQNYFLFVFFFVCVCVCVKGVLQHLFFKTENMLEWVQCLSMNVSDFFEGPNNNWYRKCSFYFPHPSSTRFLLAQLASIRMPYLYYISFFHGALMVTFQGGVWQRCQGATVECLQNGQDSFTATASVFAWKLEGCACVCNLSLGSNSWSRMIAQCLASMGCCTDLWHHVEHNRGWPQKPQERASNFFIQNCGLPATHGR